MLGEGSAWQLPACIAHRHGNRWVSPDRRDAMQAGVETARLEPKDHWEPDFPPKQASCCCCCCCAAAYVLDPDAAVTATSQTLDAHAARPAATSQRVSEAFNSSPSPGAPHRSSSWCWGAGQALPLPWKLPGSCSPVSAAMYRLQAASQVATSRLMVSSLSRSLKLLGAYRSTHKPAKLQWVTWNSI